MDAHQVDRLLREAARLDTELADVDRQAFVDEVLGRLGIAVPAEPALEGLGSEQDQQDRRRAEQGDQ